LFGIADARKLAAAYDRLSPEAHGATSNAALLASAQFGHAMLSCRQADGDAHFEREGECGWLAAAAGTLKQDRTDAQLGFERRAQGFSAGVQRELRTDLHVGVGIGYEHSKTDVEPALASSSGDQLQLGAIVKRRWGQRTLAWSLSAGRGRFDTARTVDPSAGVVARAEPRVAFAASHLRFGHGFDHGGWYLRPTVDLGWTWLERKAFDEQGAGALNLSVARQRDDVWTLRPAVEIGGDWRLASGLQLRPFVRVGALHRLSGGEAELQASLQGAAPGVAPFAVTSALDRTIGELEAAVDVFRADQSVLRFGYSGQFGDTLRSHAATVKWAWRF
jgi:outer membrane autotransporter protein